MNQDANQKAESLPTGEKMDLRRRGILFILGGLAFLFQGLFHLKDAVTGFLLAALVIGYVLFFREPPAGKQQSSLKRKALQLLGWLALFLIVVGILLLAWAWIWRITGIPFAYLAAITCGCTGLALFVWSGRLG